MAKKVEITDITVREFTAEGSKLKITFVKRNGKTTQINILEKILGNDLSDEQYSARIPENLCEDLIDIFFAIHVYIHPLKSIKF